MSLIERSNALVKKIRDASRLPLAMRAAQAVVLIPETAALLADLSLVVETNKADIADLRKELRNCARLPKKGSAFDA